MFARYVLKVSLQGNKVFDGSFVSINKAVKTACCFSDECSFYMYDTLKEKQFPSPMVSAMCKEFKYAEILL